MKLPPINVIYVYDNSKTSVSFITYLIIIET